MHIFKCNATNHQKSEILTLRKLKTPSGAARAEVQNSDIIVGKS